jgi:hypothetical protein
VQIVENRTFVLGRYVVVQKPRFDSPAWAVYLIYRNNKLVGRSFSVPDEGWCEAIERLAKTGRYAEAPIQKYSYRLRGRAVRGRTGRPTNAARAQAAADLLKIPEDA